MSDFHKGKRPDLSNLIYKSCKMNFPSNYPYWTIPNKPTDIDQRLINKLDKLIDKYGIEMVDDYVSLRKESLDKKLLSEMIDESLDTIDRPMTEAEMCCDTIDSEFVEEI